MIKLKTLTSLLILFNLILPKAGFSASETKLPENVELFSQEDNPLISKKDISKLNKFIESLSEDEKYKQQYNLETKVGDELVFGAHDGAYAGHLIVIYNKDLWFEKDETHSVITENSKIEYQAGGHRVSDEVFKNNGVNNLLVKLYSLLPPKGWWRVELKFVCDHRMEAGALCPHQDQVHFLFTLFTDVYGLNGQGQSIIWKGKSKRDASIKNDPDILTTGTIIQKVPPKAGFGYLIREIELSKNLDNESPYILHGHSGWNTSSSQKNTKVRRNLVIVRVTAIKNFLINKDLSILMYPNDEEE